MMDTKTLTVGQDVYVVSNSGEDFLQGKVTEVMPKRVVVLTAPHVLGVGILSQHYYDLNFPNCGEPFWFDGEGKNGTGGCEGNERVWV
jgi:hypothetical protein